MSPSRPTTTLILPISVDGKLVSRDAISTDPDPTWRLKPGIMGTLQQFFDFSDEGSYTLTTGATMASSGVNSKQVEPSPTSLKLVILDFDSLITPAGLNYLQQSVSNLIVFNQPMSPKSILTELKKQKVTKLTIHSTPLNSTWLQAKLIDYLTLIIYPLVVGESGTPVASLGLKDPQSLILLESQTFDTNYLCLRYAIVPTK